MHGSHSHGNGHYLQPLQHFELCPFRTSCYLRAEKAPASLWALETAHSVITTHFQALLTWNACDIHPTVQEAWCKQVSSDSSLANDKVTTILLAAQWSAGHKREFTGQLVGQGSFSLYNVTSIISLAMVSTP